MHAFGINEFSARLVNAVCGMLTLLIVYLIGFKIFDATMGLLWAIAFLGSFLPHFFFKSGIIDPVFNLFIFFRRLFPCMRVTFRQGGKKGVTLCAFGRMHRLGGPYERAGCIFDFSVLYNELLGLYAM